MSRARAMAERARERELDLSTASQPARVAPTRSWLKLLLVAGGVGLAAAWLLSPARPSGSAQPGGAPGPGGGGGASPADPTRGAGGTARELSAADATRASTAACACGCGGCCASGRQRQETARHGDPRVER